jgi:hypothetical protein
MTSSIQFPIIFNNVSTYSSDEICRKKLLNSSELVHFCQDFLSYLQSTIPQLHFVPSSDLYLYLLSGSRKEQINRRHYLRQILIDRAGPFQYKKVHFQSSQVCIHNHFFIALKLDKSIMFPCKFTPFIVLGRETTGNLYFFMEQIKREFENFIKPKISSLCSQCSTPIEQELNVDLSVSMTESIEDVVQKEVSKQLSQIDLEIEEKIEKEVYNIIQTSLEEPSPSLSTSSTMYSFIPTCCIQ